MNNYNIKLIRKLIIFAFLSVVLLVAGSVTGICNGTIDPSEDSFGSAGCSSCASSGGDVTLPSPSMREPLVYTPSGVPSDLQGPGAPYYQPNNTNNKNKESLECIKQCSFRVCRYYSKCLNTEISVPPGSNGTRMYTSDCSEPTGYNIAYDRGWGATPCIVTAPDGSQTIWQLPAVAEPVPDDYFYDAGEPVAKRDAAGNETSFNRNGNTVTVKTSTNETWQYDLDSNDRIIHITSPDLRQVDIEYATGLAAECEKHITVRDASGNNIIKDVEYEYDSQGRVEWVKMGNRQTHYYYDGNTVTVTETPKNQPNVLMRTVYDYGVQGSLTTTVTRRKNLATGSPSPYDHVTVYTFEDHDGNKGHVISMTDASNNATNYNCDSNYGGRVVSEEDPSGVVTTYQYDNDPVYGIANPIGNLMSRTRSKNGQALSTESYTYYADASGVPTSYIKTYQDERGKWTYYDRNPNSLWRLDAIKVADSEPANWFTVDPVKEFEYYSDTVEDVTTFATLTWDTGHDSTQFSPSHLNDGVVDVDHSDRGQWNYGDLLSYANASYWTWNTRKNISSIDLYVPYISSISPTKPTWLEVYGQDAAGNFTLPLYEGSLFGKFERTNNGPWVTHVPINRGATGIKIIYGATNGAPMLGEIHIYALSDSADRLGQSGQLKKEIIPDVGGVGNPQITVYEYKEVVDGVAKLRPQPTVIRYQSTNSTGEPDVCMTISYDDDGHVLSEADANGSTVWFRYDDLGRPTRTIYKWVNGVVDGTAEVYSETHYNCCAKEWSRDENGNKTYYAYDDLNRVTKSWTDIDGQSDATPMVSYTYDAFGNLETMTTHADDNTSRTTIYTYNNLNRLTKIDYPSGIVGSEEFGYDIAGNLLWKKDGNAAVTLYRYDDCNRISKVYYNYTGSLSQPISYTGLTADVSYGYEGNTNLRTSMVDSSGTSHYSYDSQGRLDLYTPPRGLPSGYYVDYDYNSAGMKTAVRITNGSVTSYDVRYSYYSNSWLKDINNGTNNIASYSYNDVGYRTLQTNSNGTSTVYAYDNDPRHRVMSITHKRGEEVLATLGYSSRDNVGNPLAVSDQNGQWSYGFDARNRLTSAIPPSIVPDQPAGGPYDYDWVGNRINPPTGNNHMVYNDADQLTKWPGMHTYNYYNDGSLKEEMDATGAVVLKSYTYTPNGRLSTTSFNGKTLVNTWDADGNRVSFAMGGNTHAFVYDITAGLPAVIQEDTVYYYREPGGALVAMQGPSLCYYHFDEIGSTRLLTDSLGAIAANYSYDAYGSVLSCSSEGNLVSQPYQYVGRLGYYSCYQEPAFGLQQLGVRFYNPEVGRFTQMDPLAEEFNLYAYVEGNPCYKVDATGKATKNVDPAKEKERQHYLKKCIDKCTNDSRTDKEINTTASDIACACIGGVVKGAGGVIGGLGISAAAKRSEIAFIKAQACPDFCNEVARKSKKGLAEYDRDRFVNYYHDYWWPDFTRIAIGTKPPAGMSWAQYNQCMQAGKILSGQVIPGVY